MSNKVTINLDNLTESEFNSALGDLIAKYKALQKPDNAVYITAILDRSGSMNTIIKDSIGGINSFINEQKKLADLGDAFVTVKIFDDKHEELFNSVALADVKEITTDQYVPRGMTALYDAIGSTLVELEAKNKKNNVIAILTDGGENASKEFNGSKVKELITKAEAKGWKFIYLGANQDSFEVSSSLGITKGFTSNFMANAAGTAAAYADISAVTRSYRSMAAQSPDSNS
jgi:hypothetical protein